MIDNGILLTYTSHVGVLDEHFAGLEGFEWDAGNSEKTWQRHEVRQVEAEEALLNRPFVLDLDVKHSRDEPRYIALGRTDTHRLLTVVFTVRGKRIRAISARPMNKKEREIHEQTQANAEADS